MNSERTMLTMARRVRKAAIAIALGIVALFALALLARGIYRGALGALHEIRPPGIDNMETTEIGGIPQVLYYRGENVENPVILYLHGGPGTPVFANIHRFQYAWEDRFTVVQWDQRLAGKTYYASDPSAVKPTVNFERALADAWEVTEAVRQKLDQDKIIVLGHSWGSVLATALVQEHPEAYSALISVGQVVKMDDMERARLEMTLSRAQSAGDVADVASLEALAPFPSVHDEGYTAARATLRRYQFKYGLLSGMTPDQVLGGLTSPYYSLRELNYFTQVDIASLQQPLTDYLDRDYDPRNFGLEYEVPVFYMMGERDGVTPCSPAEAFFAEIDAPVKRFFAIPNAGHIPMIEQADEFTRILREEIFPLVSDDAS